MCSRLLPVPPPPWHRPGLTTGERFCDKCARPIRAHVIRAVGNPFSVQFTDGPSLLFETQDEVRLVLAWAEVDLADFDRTLREKSCGSFETHLDERKRHLLKLRTRGWPWNVRELLAMWEAGTYPPQRLSPAEERIVIANRLRLETR